MKPTLAIVTNLYPPHVLGGYEILCRQVVDRLASRGWRIRVLTSTYGTERSTRDVVGDTPVYRSHELIVPFGQPPQFSRAHRHRVTSRNRLIARTWFNEEPTDVTFFWSQLRSTVGPLRAAQDLGLKRAITFNDANIASYAPAPWRSPHKALVDHTIYRQSTLLDVDWGWATCISAAVKDDLSKALGRSFDARVIHQGVPIEELPTKADLATVHSPFRILYAGQLHRYKGVHVLIDAVRLLVDRHPIALRIAGQGSDEYLAEIQRQASGLNIVFLGKLGRKALVREYQDADAFVFPSIWREPFGLTHLEAMSCGTPVVSTANGGQGEFLIDGVNALVVPPEDSRATADQLARLIEDDDLRLSLAREGVRLTRGKYSLDRYVDDLETWLLEAVG